MDSTTNIQGEGAQVPPFQVKSVGTFFVGGDPTIIPSSSRPATHFRMGFRPNMTNAQSSEAQAPSKGPLRPYLLTSKPRKWAPNSYLWWNGANSRWIRRINSGSLCKNESETSDHPTLEEVMMGYIGKAETFDGFKQVSPSIETVPQTTEVKPKFEPFKRAGEKRGTAERPKNPYMRLHPKKFFRKGNTSEKKA